MKPFDVFSVLESVAIGSIHNLRRFVVICRVDHVIHNPPASFTAIDRPAIDVFVAEFISDAAAEQLHPIKRFHSLQLVVIRPAPPSFEEGPFPDGF